METKINHKIAELQEYCEEQNKHIQNAFAFIKTIIDEDRPAPQKLNTIQNICANIESYHAMIRNAQTTINILEGLKENEQ